MTAEVTIDYDSLQQEALRGVVREVLVRVAKTGLPGEHHLYISFDVKAPGVVLSKRLREKYPHEMTIVLQHRFWDLAISEERFEVKLTFDGIPERLVVPFNAIKVFLDPSVRYVLHFEEGQVGEGVPSAEGDEAGSGPRSTQGKRPRAPRPKTRSEREASNGAALTTVQNSHTTVVPAKSAVSPAQKPVAVPAAVSTEKQAAPVSAATAGEHVGTPAAQAASAPPASAQVVSLDAFRKK
jgi:uncharacterized protein